MISDQRPHEQLGRGDAAAVPVGSRAHGTLRSRTFEVVLVGYILAVVSMTVFWPYLVGTSIAPLDFLSHYNTDAFAWWRDGGFFDPPDWMGYMWGGYPAVMDVQNSSFYLPVGIVAEAVTFDLRTSAVVSAAHVTFGGLGMYVLTRRLGMPMSVSLVGLAAWFFIGPFFGQAQHLDIMRAYAWLPWVLLLLSPYWPWRRWWSIPVGGLLLWQALLSMYPGVLIAGIYVLPLWLLGHQLVQRPRVREYLLPAAVTLGAAGAMIMLRYLPFVTIRGGTSSPRGYNSSEWSWGFLATSIYPYDLATLPNDIPFRSFFIGTTVLAALTAVAWRNRLTLICVPPLAVAVLLALPMWPWSGAVRALPGLDISRFVMSDFKPYLLVMVVLIALAAIHQLWLAAVTPRGDGWPVSGAVPWSVLRVAVMLAAVAVAVGVTGGYAMAVWLPQWLLLVLALTAVVVLSWLASGRVRGAGPMRRIGTADLATGLVVALALVAGISGFVSAMTTTHPWRVDRVQAEAVYGEPVAALIDRRVDPTQLQRQRPARTRPSEPVDIYALLAVSQNRVHYEGGQAVAGYITMAGSGAYDRMTAALLDGAIGGQTLAFWAAPGIGIASPDGALPDPAAVERCAATGECGPGVTLTPVSYQASGRFSHDIASDADTVMVFNEAYYPGWTAAACPVGGGECTDLALSGGDRGQIVAVVPAGDWRVSFGYATPRQATAWVLFWLGLTVLAGGALVSGGIIGRVRTDLARRHRGRPSGMTALGG